MKPLLLINPNTSGRITAGMLAIARMHAPAGVTVEGRTVRDGVPLINDERQLATGAAAVAELAASLDPDLYGGFIVAAFGDPGVAELRGATTVPVTGLAEAALAEAAAGGRRFAIVTTTPALTATLGRLARAYGVGAQLTGIRCTTGDHAELLAAPARLEAALARACERAVHDDGAAAIVIGGGPLSAAAAALAGHFGTPIVQPVPAAVRMAVARATSPTSI
ncbi:aspartate/glutamate racemase family protein [Nocardia tengchongensis]